MQTRRQFLVTVAASLGTAAVLSTPRALAQETPAPVKQEETDPMAQALGYRHDSATVDGAKYPMHTAESKCSACALYTGQPGEEWGGCNAFAGKLVKANGWCMAFAKKQ